MSPSLLVKSSSTDVIPFLMRAFSIFGGRSSVSMGVYFFMPQILQDTPALVYCDFTQRTCYVLFLCCEFYALHTGNFPPLSRQTSTEGLLFLHALRKTEIVFLFAIHTIPRVR